MPIFNMVPPPGIPAQFAYRAPAQQRPHQLPCPQRRRLRPDGLPRRPQRVVRDPHLVGEHLGSSRRSRATTRSGSPAAELPLRAPIPNRPRSAPCSRIPPSCNGPLATTMEATTWQHPEQVTSAAVFEAPAMGGCGQLDFNPSIEAKTTTNLADSPSGLAVDIQVPQNKDAEGLAAAHLRQVKFMLPRGPDRQSLRGQWPRQLQRRADRLHRAQQRAPAAPLRPAAGETSRARSSVSFKGQSTAPIAATASRSEVTQAIETLPGLAGNVSLSGSQGGWIVELTGALAGTDVPPDERHGHRQPQPEGHGHRRRRHLHAQLRRRHHQSAALRRIGRRSAGSAAGNPGDRARKPLPGQRLRHARQSRRRQTLLRSDLRRRPGRPAADDDRHLLADRPGSGRQRRPGPAAPVP